MNKKALSLKMLIELILFILITLLLALPFIMKMYGYFVEKPETGTIKSLDALAIEINNLGKDRPQTVPVYVDKDHLIAGYAVSDKKPTNDSCDNDKSFLCICSLKEICSSQDKNMKCKALDFDLKEKVMINAKLVNSKGEADEDGNAIIQNCALTRDDQLVSVSCS